MDLHSGVVYKLERSYGTGSGVFGSAFYGATVNRTSILVIKNIMLKMAGIPAETCW